MFAVIINLQAVQFNANHFINCFIMMTCIYGVCFCKIETKFALNHLLNSAEASFIWKWLLSLKSVEP